VEQDLKENDNSINLKKKKTVEKENEVNKYSSKYIKKEKIINQVIKMI